MATPSGQDGFVLGIDVGTTSIKICLMGSSSKQIIELVSQETNAQIPSDLGNLQDVNKIFKALEECIARLPSDKLSHVVAISICGQMHGIIFWNQTEQWMEIELKDIQKSPLYTWLDDRCSPAFLSSLPKPDSHIRLSTGYGCCTILWFLKYQPEILKRYNRCGTIHDFLVAYLCRLEKPVMSDQNALSWGYFNSVSSTWNIERLEQVDFPIHLLPVVVKSQTVVGKTQSTRLNLPILCPVYVALGDLQCSVMANLEKETDAVLNISTSAQLCCLMPKHFDLTSASFKDQAIDYFPYFSERYLAVAASLNGGNVLEYFVCMLQQWTEFLGVEISKETIWKRITAADPNVTTNITVDPILYGERHRPSERASVTNIDSPLHLLQVYASICRGLISNLHSMISIETLKTAGIQRIVGSGNALTRNIILQQELEKIYGLPFVCNVEKEAAVGAAMAALNK